MCPTPNKAAPNASTTSEPDHAEVGGGVASQSASPYEPGVLPALPTGVSREFLLHHGVCPEFATSDGTLRVLVAPDAILPDAIDDLEIAYACSMVEVPAPRGEVDRLIARLTTSRGESLAVQQVDDADTIVADVRDVANSAPVAAYVNLLFGEALRARASDVHLEGGRAGLHVRFRIDGVLTTAPESPRGLEAAVVSRLKLMADLDIAERRRPQDGRIRVRLADRDVDVRVSTVPTIHGESVVLRLLDRGGRPVALEDLGLPGEMLTPLRRFAERPHGMVLVTGPTGSGKTTTLYAALRLRDAVAEKIITVEDPIEYQLPGIAQVPVHATTGVTFATALRSILRQDPDVLMIGETRDGETASLAVQAALTGHLVLSTLHTNDALSAIPRLLDLGVPAYLIAATLDAVVAQRLVRRICSACRVFEEPTPQQVALLGEGDYAPSTIARGVGCAACWGSGYKGRLGVFELLTVDEALKAMVARGGSLQDLRAAALRSGWHPLVQDGWRMVAAGLTTIEEIERATEG